MRIAVLTSLYPGPPLPYEGVFAARRWGAMARRGHEVRVTQPEPRTPGPLARGHWRDIRRMPRSEVRDGIPVERPRYLHVPGLARRNARRFARVGLGALLSGWEGGEPDVVVCDYAWPAAAVAPLLAQRGVPCVISGRGSDVSLVAGQAGLGDELAGYLRAAGHWCAVSEDLVRRMDGLAGREGHGVLVPNGVDLDGFRIADRGAARRRLGLIEQRPLVLVVGHLIERKDPLLALEVFARGAPENATCAFLGRGPLRDRLVERIAAAGLDDRVQVFGEVGPRVLVAWYAACDVLLLTSRREGRPNVVLEALASGRPVLATDAGGTGELLRPFAERSLARTRDPDELARMLAALLADPPAPDALRESVASLSWEHSAEALERCLTAAVEGGASAT